MIIKTEKYEIEIYDGVEIYLGSKKSGQIFKKWEDLKEEEMQKIMLFQNAVENLLITSDKMFNKDPYHNQRNHQV